MRPLLAFAWIACCPAIGYVQVRTARPPQPAPAFVSVSLKAVPALPGSPPIPPVVGDRSIQPQGLRIAAASLLQMIELAYPVRNAEIQFQGLSGWMRTDRWSVQARARPGTPDLMKHPALARQLIRRLLADRFNLQIRMETQTLQVYGLWLAGSKPMHLVAAVAPSQPHLLYFKGDQVQTAALTMGDLASVLSGHLGRTVTDETGLKGTYKFTITLAGLPNRATYQNMTILRYRGLVQALGLKLADGKGPVEVYVVTNASRPQPD